MKTVVDVRESTHLGRAHLENDLELSMVETGTSRCRLCCRISDTSRLWTVVNGSVLTELPDLSRIVLATTYMPDTT